MCVCICISFPFKKFVNTSSAKKNSKDKFGWMMPNVTLLFQVLSIITHTEEAKSMDYMVWRRQGCRTLPYFPWSVLQGPVSPDPKEF